MRNTKVSCKAKEKQAARPNAGGNDDRVASTRNETNPSKRRREYNIHLDDSSFSPPQYPTPTLHPLPGILKTAYGTRAGWEQI